MYISNVFIHRDMWKNPDHIANTEASELLNTNEDKFISNIT